MRNDNDWIRWFPWALGGVTLLAIFAFRTYVQREVSGAANPGIWMQENSLLFGAMLWSTLLGTVMAGVMAIAGLVVLVRWCWPRARTVAMGVALVGVFGAVTGFSPYVAPSWELVTGSAAICAVGQQPPPDDGSGDCDPEDIGSCVDCANGSWWGCLLCGWEIVMCNAALSCEEKCYQDHPPGPLYNLCMEACEAGG